MDGYIHDLYSLFIGQYLPGLARAVLFKYVK